LTPEQGLYRERATAALNWVFRSSEACGGRGSAHSYSLLWGWAKAYPETTGYLIPTLLNWSSALNSERYAYLARQYGNWLVTLQHPQGAWVSGVVGGRRLSVFNTAMIADGLSALAKQVPNEHIAAERARRGLAWLLSVMDADGVWRQGLYVPGFVPAYHAYAVAAVLRAANRMGLEDAHPQLQGALAHYAGYFRGDSSLANAGLKPGPWAFTHTLAYALKGLWELAVFFQEKEIQQQVLLACRRLFAVWEKHGRIAGRYREGWKGDYSFTSPVGNAQLSLLFRTIGSHTGDAVFVRWADRALAAALQHQCLSSHPDTSGAIPGSVPRWGPYLRWRYPNWGAKFLLDALYAAWVPDRVG
jgi:hypothetical protein